MRAYGAGLEAVATVEGGLAVLRTVVVPRWTEKRGEKEERIKSWGEKEWGETRMRAAKKKDNIGGQTTMRVGVRRHSSSTREGSWNRCLQPDANAMGTRAGWTQESTH